MNKSLVKEILKNTDLVKYKYPDSELWCCTLIQIDWDVERVAAILTDKVIENELITKTSYDLLAGVYLYKATADGFKLTGLINDKGVFLYE